MGHAGGEEADAREPLGTDELTALGPHLLFEFLVEPIELGRHAVEFVGQFGELATAAGLEPPVELPRRQRAYAAAEAVERRHNGTVLRCCDAQCCEEGRGT